MHENARERLSYTVPKPLEQPSSIGFQTVLSCRKYSTLPYTQSSKGRSSSAEPAERADLSKTQRARPTAGHAPNQTMTEYATDDEYSSTSKETTVSPDRRDPEPQHFADVHVTLSGQMQFIDSENSDRWITTDTMTEVRR